MEILSWKYCISVPQYFPYKNIITFELGDMVQTSKLPQGHVVILTLDCNKNGIVSERQYALERAINVVF